MRPKDNLMGSSVYASRKRFDSISYEALPVAFFIAPFIAGLMACFPTGFVPHCVAGLVSKLSARLKSLRVAGPASLPPL